MNWLKDIFKTPTKKKIEDSSPNEVLHKMKLGLALSGGGTRGTAYIGVFKAFEEAGLHFDYVAGTSAGSLLGAAYCAGVSIDKMADIARNVKAKDVLTSKISFMPSKTEGLERLIDEALDGKTFEDLNTPFCAVAVDIISGNEVHLTSGKLSTAVAGSCAFPGAFNPVERPPYRLMDGGLQNNIPADVVRDMGADIVLAVDLNPTRGYGTDSTKYLEVIKAALRILMKSNSVKGYVHCDYMLKLDLTEFSQMKMEGVEEMIEIGYNMTKAEMPNILKVLGMRVPDENIKETARRLKMMQKRAKQIAREKKNKREETNVLGQVQRGEEESEGSCGES